MFLEDDESAVVLSYFTTLVQICKCEKRKIQVQCLLKFQCSPVVVVEVDGAPSGIRPQWGPSNEQFICILCKYPGAKSVRELSSLKSTMCSTFAKV
jgi:hypothetical protein